MKIINSWLIIIIGALSMLSACQKRQTLSVKDINEQYSQEEIEELFKMMTDSLGENNIYNKRLEEATEIIAMDTILKALFVIYGPDDRVDLYDEDVPERVNNALGVMALVFNDSLVDLGDGRFRLKTSSLKSFKNVCGSERFSAQPVGAFCTGFAAGPNTIVTAGHCLGGDADLQKISFVLGFTANSATDFNTNFDNNMILTGKRIISRVNNQSMDYAVIETNESIPADRILTLNSDSRTMDTDSLYVIGFPSGLPMKIADGASVRSNDNPNHFVANLDSYGGNSGSPVFNLATHEVEGMLVSGEIDYVLNGDCRISNTCPNTGCRGEVVSRVSQFAGFINTEELQ